MKIIVPFTYVIREQVRALMIDHVEPLYVYMEEESSYWRLLKRLWEERETFVLVEHDIIPWPGAIAALWACDSPWCTYEYPLENYSILAGFGCTLVRDVLMEAVPNVWDEAPETHWWGLDSWLSHKSLSLLGRDKPHLHAPPVTHLNPWRFPLDSPVHNAS